MKHKLIVANWKMNTVFSEAVVLATGIGNGLRNFKELEVAVCPPAIWLMPIAELIKKNLFSLKLGAQNIFYKDEGAYTGEISPAMIKKICDYVIIGHSERRVYFKETDEDVNFKIKAALKHDLTPILCVGEFKKLGVMNKKKIAKNKNEIMFSENINRQLSVGLDGISRNDIARVVIAYEPVWAIGMGKSASGVYAGEMVRNIRNRLAIIYDRDIARDIKILYGGSVSASNVLVYLKRPEINGLLVGGVSLNIKEFTEICRQASII